MTPYEVRMYKLGVIEVEAYFLELEIWLEQQAEIPEPLISYPDDESPCPKCGGESEFQGLGDIAYHVCIVCEHIW